MRTICVTVALVLTLAVCCSAAAYDRNWLEGQVDWVISEINSGNNGMHYLAREYSRAAKSMGGFEQWKIDTLDWYLRNMPRHPPIVDRWR